MNKLYSALVSIFLVALCCKTKPGVGEIFITAEGAIGGYDAVAYFNDNKPVKGIKEFSHNWKGAEWYFLCSENLSAFKKSPEKYAPQYGGFCAYGAADGHKAITEPEAWTIVNGKLYLNYNQEVKKIWLEDKDKFIKQADANWPRVKPQEF